MMKLLKSPDDFYKLIDIRSYDNRQQSPKECPCYAYEVVTNWGMEESGLMYLYKEDLEKMLESLNK